MEFETLSDDAKREICMRPYISFNFIVDEILSKDEKIELV